MTRKERMLNAYKGIYSDCIPVAPEFWVFYPAKVLNVDIMEYQREYPLWYGLQQTFNKFNSDGWGTAGGTIINNNIVRQSEIKKIDEDAYRETIKISYGRKEFLRTIVYYKTQPCWAESYPIKEDEDIHPYIEAVLNNVLFDFKAANEAYEKVGDDYLLEFGLGSSFFDFFAEAMGFEKAIYYFLNEDEIVLRKYYDLYYQHTLKLLHEAIKNTKYESYFIGCSYSCVSLLGPNLWRKWDKPFEKSITDEAHRFGKLVHCHSHGKCMEIVKDYVEIGFDCVCPFERNPGDVNGLIGLQKVRGILADRVTFNGNVHTVEALINGTPDIVKEQVREIKEAFHGTSRVIIGTGDQVGAETPEENIWAMMEEGRKGNHEEI